MSIIKKIFNIFRGIDRITEGGNVRINLKSDKPNNFAKKKKIHITENNNSSEYSAPKPYGDAYSRYVPIITVKQPEPGDEFEDSKTKGNEFYEKKIYYEATEQYSEIFMSEEKENIDYKLRLIECFILNNDMEVAIAYLESLLSDNQGNEEIESFKSRFYELIGKKA